MYICENGIFREMTIDEEMRLNKEAEILAQQQAELEKHRPPTIEEEIAALKKENETLTQCILEMSTVVYK